MDRWTEKVAIVTGASAGIGAAIVEELVKNGIIVAGLARRVERVEALAEKLQEEKGKLYAFKCDIRNEQEVISIFKLINNKIGTIQILVNNAGLLQPTELIDGDTEKWKTTLDTNILGLCVATREAIKYMKASEVEGHIFHINSILGHRILNMPGLNVYPASKYAVTALAETLRREITREGLPIRISSISPGYVKTEFAEVGFGGDLDIPGLEPEDIASTIIYGLSTPVRVNYRTLEKSSFRFMDLDSIKMELLSDVSPSTAHKSLLYDIRPLNSVHSITKAVKAVK